MTFDQFANQGGSAAWDGEESAATKKAADKIFATGTEKNGVDETTVSGEDDSLRDPEPDSPVPDSPVSDSPDPDSPAQPGNVPDPDVSVDS